MTHRLRIAGFPEPQPEVRRPAHFWVELDLLFQLICILLRENVSKSITEAGLGLFRLDSVADYIYSKRGIWANNIAKIIETKAYPVRR